MLAISVLILAEDFERYFTVKSGIAEISTHRKSISDPKKRNKYFNEVFATSIFIFLLFE